MTNADIRKYAKEKRVNLWQIANVLGIQDTTFSKKLRFELDEESRKRIFSIIDELSPNNIKSTD